MALRQVLQPPVGRFAPSPSGRMHLGNVFSALLAWLSVRAAGGTMLLRIEDLDPQRSRPEYAQAIRDDLRWLGLDWDEECPCQSQREPTYRQAFEKLEAMGLVYPCYCSRSELHDASAPHAGDGSFVYSGACRKLTPGQRAQKTRPPAWRLCVPDETVWFTDGLQGCCGENLLRSCGDFIIRRSDGVYAYQLAVVVDDAEAGVSQVVRGADLLGSTPRQLYVYRLLGYEPPEFFHVPLLTAPDGRRLSKRDGDLDLGRLRQSMGPEQLLGVLACAAGILPAPQPCSARDLAEQFSWERVTRAKSVDIRAILHKIPPAIS